MQTLLNELYVLEHPGGSRAEIQNPSQVTRLGELHSIFPSTLNK